MDIIIAIALLCQATGGSTWDWTHKHQLNCQKYYIDCIGVTRTADALAECVTKK